MDTSLSLSSCIPCNLIQRSSLVDPSQIPIDRCSSALASMQCPVAGPPGEAGTVATGLSHSEAGVLSGMEWVSVTEDQLGNPANWGPAVSRFDRVYLPERGTWHTINSITPSATGRFNINLTRVQEPQ